jgi:hypothetical protein
MSAVRRIGLLSSLALVVAIGSGCEMTRPISSRDNQSARNIAPSAPRQKPAWLTTGTAPLPPKMTPIQLPAPESLAAQLEPTSPVPRIEEERSTANNPVAAPLTPVIPAAATVTEEPEWKAAGERRAP